MTPAIDTIVFDVGWVLVRLDYEPLLSYFAAAGIPASEMPDIVRRIDLDAHERGEKTSDDLLDALVGLAPGRIDRAEVARLWVDMFEPVEPMFELARALAASYRVHLLSNVGELHWAELVRRFGLDLLGHGALPSFEARVMKPDPRIYEAAERRFGLNVARTVFVDDLPANVAAAQARGWYAIQHVAPDSTAAALAELGVCVEPCGAGVRI